MNEDRAAPISGEDAVGDLNGAAGSPASDRTITPVRGHLGGGRGKAVVLAALAVGSVTLLGLTWEQESAEADAPREPARQVIAFDERSEQPPRPTLAEPGPHPPTLSGGSTPTVPAIELRDKQSPAADESHGREPEKSGSLLIYSRPTRRAASDSLRPHNASPNGSTAIDELSQGSRLTVLRAGRLPDRNFLILAGTSLPCVLMTALDSTVPGYASCIVPRDVLSDNGMTVVLEKGTRVLGEHRAGMRQGQRRIFVLWTRAVTPGGVVISLASPAADALGRAGFDGDVDSRFWERFGGALALSLVDDGAYAAFGSRSDYARLPSDAAAVALEESFDIAPVLRKSQGGEMSIFVAHDLDFSSVYSLRSR